MASPAPQDKKRVFRGEELREAFGPTLRKLYDQFPESLPFRQPVDPQALRIPDYFSIVKKPIDLSTIKKKLESGSYSDPWEYVDDVWLMLSNAWLYNKRSSPVYRFSTKLSQVFEAEMDPVMRALGYCCGRSYSFYPQTLCCSGKDMCTVQPFANYYTHHHHINKYFCHKCFTQYSGDTISLGDDPTTSIRKDEFVEMKNEHVEPEPFVACNVCSRKFHQICVLHLDSISPQGFTCGNCMNVNKVVENKFRAKSLHVTKLGAFIETRVRNFLRRKKVDGSGVHIRVLSSSNKVVEVQPGMRRRFVGTPEESLKDNMPYRAKSVFAFQEIDGNDVSFFGMHVQEYGSQCPLPNTRRVYIAYLDSVNFFKPEQFRSAVYHQIILGYLQYAKQLGYTIAHVWACPPPQGDDYIFYSHPPEQKIPTAKRLQKWYRRMLDKGIMARVVYDYKNVLKQAIEDKVSSVAELPYFEGDFWPSALEEWIKQVDEEQDIMASDEARDISVAQVDGGGARVEESRKSNDGKDRKKIWDAEHLSKDLSAKMFATMKTEKDMHLVIRLHSAEAAASLPEIKDPDPLIPCELMDGRVAFWTLARDRHYEFSSLRRAKFSTMAMLYEVHNEGGVHYVCNNCNNQIETIRFNCRVCPDFDLCVACLQDTGHPHKMEKVAAKIDNSTDAPKLSVEIDKCVEYLAHARECADPGCLLATCRKLKSLFRHAKLCKRKCSVSKQLISIYFHHAKNCEKEVCPLSFCHPLKDKLYQQQQQQRHQPSR